MANEKAEPTRISAEAGQSLTAFRKETTETVKYKSQASGLLEGIAPTRKQGMAIQNHLHSIGADRDVLSEDDKVNRQIMYKWFRTLVLFNDQFPADLPVSFVLDEFFEDILQHRVSLKGHNLHAHIQAFREWVSTRVGHARRKYWIQLNPESRPKELAPNASRSEKEKRDQDNRVDRTLELLYGDQVPEQMKKFKRENTNGG